MAIFNALLNLRELKELYSGKPVCVCPLYNGVINTPKTYEATGNPIVLPKYKSLVKLKTTFSPKQAGTGDPSPENMRPISGWDKVTVTRCGKNLLNLETQTFTRNKDVLLDNEIPPGSYTLSANVQTNSGSDSCLVNFLDSQDALVTSAYMLVSDTSQSMITLSRKVKVLSMYAARNNANAIGYQATLSNIQLELGSTSTAYEPYQGSTTILTLPETIYGGMVDAVTGAGSKTWGFIASYNGEAIPGEWISDRDMYAPGTTPTTGAQVAYKLATPESFKVPQVTIPSLKGENYFFTNGENMDIIYKKEFFWGDEA